MSEAAKQAAALLDRVSLANKGDPRWEVRRKSALRLIWWGCGMATFVIVTQPVAQSASVVGALLFFITSIYGVYVGGTVVEDKDKRRLGVGDKA